MDCCEFSYPYSALSADVTRKYLADGNVDVRLATENVLAEFLREIKYIATVQEKHAETIRNQREAKLSRKRENKQKTETSTVADDESAVESEVERDDDQDEGDDQGGEEQEWEGEGSGNWVPGQGVFVDHTAIMDIIIQHLSYPGECFSPRLQGGC
jgi:vacuole morphology and inheritance protein 14